MTRLTNMPKPIAGLLALVLASVPLRRAAAGDPPAMNTEVQCDTHQLELPDLETLRLADGEHVITGADTSHGKIEVRVTVKKGAVAGPFYYIRGKRLAPWPASRIPQPLLACLAQGFRCEERKSAERSSDGWFSTAARGVLDWIEPTAEAKTNISCYVMSSGCYHDDCCAEACCVAGGTAHIHCVHWCTSYEE